MESEEAQEADNADLPMRAIKVRPNKNKFIFIIFNN